ncbi:LacI family DNA-binding transcriptional regulator [Lactobacillaceae bacterium Scapto_B20]
MGKRITIQDIAELAGVSKSTVSRAINNDPRISRNTRDQIQEIIKTHHYRPNLIAKSIATKQTMLIGVVIPTFENQFFSKILDVLQSHATRHGYQLMITTTKEQGELEIKGLQKMIEHMVDGLIIVSSGKIEHYQQLIAQTPVVFIDRIANQMENVNFDTILVDNINGSYNIVQKMIDNGSERIGIIANSLFKSKSNRLIGYQRALINNQIELDPDIISYCRQDGQNADKLAGQLLINQACDGIFATDNTILKSVLKQIELHHLSNVQVGTFDDNPYLSLLGIPIIANQQPSREMGSKAFELLMAQMNGSKHSVKHIKLKTNLKLY